MSASATRSAPLAEPLAVTLAAQAIALANAAARDDALAAWREQARKQLADNVFPDKRTEQWKYTRLTALDNGHLAHSAAAASEKDLPFDLPAPLAPHRLVLINGRYQPGLSNPPAEGLRLTRLDGSENAPLTVIDDSLRTPFAWLNSAALEDGLVLTVPDGVTLDAPIEVLLVSCGDTPSVCHPRLRLHVGAGSRATLIERYIGTGAVLTNAVTELFSGIGGDLVHYRLQAEAPEALHIGTLVINPGRDSRAHSFQLMQGSALRRNDVRVLLDGSGAHVGLNGIFVGQGKTHTDNQICVEHRTPHASSEQVFKGMAGDQAKLVFNGRIHIFEGARGTRAELSNKNLLLTDGAEINTKPELEIYNDDVKCSHGSTCGQLDAQALFYLRSRGIPGDEAKRMLAFGFVNELLSALPDAAVAEWARPWLEGALTVTEKP
ncbi:Fe-S cluster assembly protein SufD [Isoalcanivorax indicus]|uniref:Fe-S cluster assembly protein SufD n=1 Tax=Isoalcanivorax indicus TaxID=2202653 RepID=UPI000DB95D10|nr:Fe-S cluster assembly protein SufD [Isoalcanivorax indicus]